MLLIKKNKHSYWTCSW